ncbi:MAG TPA: PKD domain-containing protein [Puia sp.]
MGRVCLIVAWLMFSFFQLSAQSGGYSNLEFVENKGQWDPLVKFRAQLNAGTLFMQQKGFTVLMHDTNDLSRIRRLLHGDPVAGGRAVVGTGNGKKVTRGAGAVVATGRSTKTLTGGHAGKDYDTDNGGKGPSTGTDPYLLHSHTYQVSFENASDQVEIVADKPLPGYSNYFIGDKKNWAPHCMNYQGILYRNMYDGIDVHYYSDRGFVKYDIIVHPGADPNKIVLKYDGQSKLSIKKNRIYVETSVGTVQELEPHSYQLTAQGRADVVCNYVLLSGNRIQFKLKDYVPGATLVIDPTEVFCSFTGSKSDNWGYTATYDASGNFYAGGIVLDETHLPGGGTNGSGFLVSPGAFQSTFQGGDGSEGGPAPGYDYDVGIIKLSSNGANRLYATYLGGSGDEQPHSMIVDNSGNLIVTGRTSSPNFPSISPVSGDGGGFDIFITKLNADGTGLIGSRRIGGTESDGVNFKPKYLVATAADEGAQQLRLNYGDDGRGEVITDDAGNIYVASCTQSKNFPLVNPFQGASGGGQDGVVIKTSPDISTILFSSYIGGDTSDAAFVLALSPTDNTLWVAGGTMSSNLPGTAGGMQPKPAGGIDGFVAQVSSSGGTLFKASYYGTTGTDMIYGLEFDKLGFPYVMGTTTGVIPVVNSPFNAGGNQASGKQFITKLKKDLSGVVYSANFGPANSGSPNISPTAFLVDRCENVYVSGWGGGADLTDKYLNSGTTGLVVTSDAQKPSTDGEDFYFFVLQKNAASQLYGSFFGQVRGGFGDHVDGGTSRFDKQGVIYQAVCANCYGGAQFPTTPGVWASANGTGSSGCNEAAVKIAFHFAGVAAGLKSVTHGRGDSVGCVPLAVSFSDTIRNAKSYIWNFGDGTIVDTTAATLDHSYNAVGNYTVTLIAIDSNSCNVADTSYRTIEVRDNPAFLDFRYDKNGPCDQFNYVFTNLSTHAPGAPNFTDTSFTWTFGDGSAPLRDGLTQQPNHSYGSPGPYNVTLTLVDTNYCNYPMDTVKLLYVAQNVKAQFTTPAFGCAPYTAVFSNTSIAGQKYYWNFGDESPIDSTDISPSHLYTNAGTYTVTLTAVDSTTCNITDTYTFTINVQGKPTAGFTYTPLSPQPPNTPTVFTDASSPVVKYEWFFGDGSSEIKSIPDTVVHQYNKTDTFQVCLVVTNESGCTDTVCHPVAAVIDPLLDVPNAFTPGRFGQNAIIKVVGFGITHMTWRIYNRWGQKVFESNDPYYGWDGTNHGLLQPMDVYAYTLEAEFSDGSHATKKGDITLIR